MVPIDCFRNELIAHLDRAAKRGAENIFVTSGELHRACGGYLVSGQGIPESSAAMSDECCDGDVVVMDRSHGAAMTVKYLLPRAQR